MMETSFTKIAHMLESFNRLADQVIMEAKAVLLPEKIVKNFKDTGEYERIKKSLSKEKIEKLDDSILEAAEEMCTEISDKTSKYNTKKIEFIQFTDPRKEGGYDGGYLIPVDIYSSDKLKVVGPMTKKEDREKSERIIVLGEYLTKKAFGKIKK